MSKPLETTIIIITNKADKEYQFLTRSKKKEERKMKAGTGEEK